MTAPSHSLAILLVSRTSFRPPISRSTLTTSFAISMCSFCFWTVHAIRPRAGQRRDRPIVVARPRKRGQKADGSPESSGANDGGGLAIFRSSVLPPLLRLPTAHCLHAFEPVPNEKRPRDGPRA